MKAETIATEENSNRWTEKKKQSLKNEIKNLKKNKKRAISFSRGKPASYKVITGR